MRELREWPEGSLTDRADETIVASFPSRAAAALAAGALRASGISAWPEIEDERGSRVLLVVRTQEAPAARELLAASQPEPG